MLSQDTAYISGKIKARIGELLIARDTLNSLLYDPTTSEEASRLLPQQDYLESQLPNIQVIKTKFDDGTWTYIDVVVATTFLTGAVYHVGQVKELAGKVEGSGNWLVYASIAIGIIIVYKVFIK